MVFQRPNPFFKLRAFEQTSRYEQDVRQFRGIRDIERSSSRGAIERTNFPSASCNGVEPWPPPGGGCFCFIRQEVPRFRGIQIESVAS